MFLLTYSYIVSFYRIGVWEQSCFYMLRGVTKSIDNRWETIDAWISKGNVCYQSFIESRNSSFDNVRSRRSLRNSIASTEFISAR